MLSKHMIKIKRAFALVFDFAFFSCILMFNYLLWIRCANLSSHFACCAARFAAMLSCFSFFRTSLKRRRAVFSIAFAFARALFTVCVIRDGTSLGSPYERTQPAVRSMGLQKDKLTQGNPGID